MNTNLFNTEAAESRGPSSVHFHLRNAAASAPFLSAIVVFCGTRPVTTRWTRATCVRRSSRK